MDLDCPAVPIPSPGPRVLVCALDWGLGHASRSSVLVRSWVEQGASVTLAGNGRSLAFWRKEFPGLPCRVLPDYGIRYAPGPLLLPSLLLSLPRLASVRSAEYRLVQSWRDDFDAGGCHEQHLLRWRHRVQPGQRTPRPQLLGHRAAFCRCSEFRLPVAGRLASN